MVLRFCDSSCICPNVLTRGAMCDAETTDISIINGVCTSNSISVCIKCKWCPELVTSGSATHLAVFSSTDLIYYWVTGKPPSANSPTSPLGEASQAPARWTGMAMVSHVQIDDTSPSTCASTCVRLLTLLKHQFQCRFSQHRK